jgi:guanylate kinase
MVIDQSLLQKVSDYRPDPSAIQSISNAPLVFLVGIAGAGKDSLLTEILRRHPNEFQFIVSHTTRKPRSNNGVMEQDGVEYHYIDFATAEHMLDIGAYVEANVVYYQDIYGTAIAEIQNIQQQGKIAISDIEVQGVQQYVDLHMNVRPIFVIPPSFDIWWKRFQGRYGGNINWQDTFRRMKTALEELEDARTHDYYYIVVNDKFDDTVDAIHSIALGQQQKRRSTDALETMARLANDMAIKLEAWQAEHPV